MIRRAPDLLSITNASLQRGSTTVFEGLSLQLNEPRIGLIGDNGAGKSSLFRLACGLDAPQAGTVTLQGHTAYRISSRKPNFVGMMFQNAEEQIVFPTVQEELALGLTATGQPRRDALVHARAFLASRGLADWAERAISSLSQGQRQHVCWLATLVCSPSLILMHDDIARAPQQIIVSTHVLEHLQHFDRVVWLDKGQVRADGAPATVCAQYQEDVAARIAARTAAVG